MRVVVAALFLSNRKRYAKTEHGHGLRRIGTIVRLWVRGGDRFDARLRWDTVLQQILFLRGWISSKIFCILYKSTELLEVGSELNPKSLWTNFTISVDAVTLWSNLVEHISLHIMDHMSPKHNGRLSSENKPKIYCAQQSTAQVRLIPWLWSSFSSIIGTNVISEGLKRPLDMAPIVSSMFFPECVRKSSALGSPELPPRKLITRIEKYEFKSCFQDLNLRVLLDIKSPLNWPTFG